jgi:hypothetical protein
MPEYAVPILPSRDLQETLALYPVTGSRLHAPTDTEYGMRAFALVDRSGNLVPAGS